MVEFVVREGPLFEAMIMKRESNNPYFKFLFDCKRQDHVYYRWRLFSILQGDTPTEWRTTYFRMFKGGSLWIPPVLNQYFGRTEIEESTISEEEVKKGQLRSDHRKKLETLLEELTPSKDRIASAMMFCLDRADAAEEVVEHIANSFSSLQTSFQMKVSRLYLVSDVLYNSSAKVAGASYYRKFFEVKLPQIFDCLNATHKNIQARLQAEQFKQKITNCFRAWDDWAIYPDFYLIQLQNIFLGIAKLDEVKQEEASCELDGVPLASSLIDGLPLDGSTVDDIDGCPMGVDSLDGVPVDDIDGVPLEESSVLSGVPLSKWEKSSDTRTFLQAKTESKWDTADNQDEDKVNVSCNLQDEDEGSESDSSADFSIAPNYDSAVFQSSLKSFQMTESKRKKLRELEVKVMKYQDELESGKRQTKSGMSVTQQVTHYRHKLLQKEFLKDEEKNERSKSKDKQKDDKRKKERSKKKDDGDKRRTSDPGDRLRKSRSISPLRTKSPKRSKRSRSPCQDQKVDKSRSRSPHRSHKKAKRSKH